VIVISSDVEDEGKSAGGRKSQGREWLHFNPHFSKQGDCVLKAPFLFLIVDVVLNVLASGFFVFLIILFTTCRPTGGSSHPP
jgi:hypothetical protein